MADRSLARHALDVAGRAAPFHGRAPPLRDREPPRPAAFFRSVDDPLLTRHVPPLRQCTLDLEGHLAAQVREIQELLSDNQRLAATHVALRQEHIASQHELRVSASAVTRARAEVDAEVRGAYEQSLKVEAEARAVWGMRAELAQVRSDVHRLGAAKDEDATRLQELRGALERTRIEHAQAAAIMKEIEAMRQEIQKGRAAIEFEKNVHAENFEQRQMIEANMVSLAHEVEKLHADLDNLESRAKAASAGASNPAQVRIYGNSEAAFGESNYAHAYGLQQVLGNADNITHYVPDPCGIQQNHPQR